eukprot:TRINITY_DN2957_c1_g1_i1.p1 TRINITY_DN2957_c1_g1~~TRINITY_DN2957_c1_g1_i1.p1  ORF type:complete len:419 (+),score=64.80 TRINITY_DN2957_c1_g1_i1:69-1325(+)
MARAASQAFASLRRLGADLRIAALETAIRQDPTHLGRRTAAAAHYCQQVAQLQNSLASSSSSSSSSSFSPNPEEEELIGRTSEHLEYILNASRDIDQLHSVISEAVSPKQFYTFPRLTAKYMRKIGLHRECMQEFISRSEFEERATPYHLGNALTILKASGEWEAAQELFDEATNLEWKGQPVSCGWTALRQTPAVHIEGLTHSPFWDGDSRPALADELEAHYNEIMEDVRSFLERRRAAKAAQTGEVPAYPNLVVGEDGVWDMLQLYSSRKWHKQACAIVPQISSLLRMHLPTSSLPYIHYNTEEVVLFLLAPGSSVRLHNGGSNVPINLSLGLTGCEGSFVEVAGEKRPFKDGKVVAFDDGSDHRVWHDGHEDRWVLVVRMMHPELVANPNRYFSRAFTRRTAFETWDKKRAASWA